MIAYAIKAAKESGVFKEVIVSTDNEEIAEVARSFGATIPWLRSKDLSNDHSTTISVMQDAVKKLKTVRFAPNLHNVVNNPRNLPQALGGETKEKRNFHTLKHARLHQTTDYAL